MKVFMIFGTRPEAVKMCPLALRLKSMENIDCHICLTGQHKEMLEQVMEIFRLEADYNLGIMKPAQTLCNITADIVKGLEPVLIQEKPDLILVHGDTSSSFAAALAGFYRGIPIGHVEAGLRTYNMHSPYPEEFNRQAVDLVTWLYFAPTEGARNNLLKEGKNRKQIFVTGNTVIDALKLTVREDYQHEHMKWIKGSRLILFTAHRRENQGEPLNNIFRALKRIVRDFQDVKVIYPIHKNPSIRKAAGEILGEEKRIRITEPLDVVDFHNYMARSYLILTDSGGIQEEAPSLGKPVLVMRDTTERPEGLAAGTLKLVGTKEEDIYQAAKRLLTDRQEYTAMSKAVNPYGDGHASERIADIILRWYQHDQKRWC